MLNTAQERTEWGPPCSSGRGVTLDLNGAGRVYVDRRITDAVRGLNQCLAVWRYQTRRADTGAYACRPITGGTNYSLHAYLIALDLNWSTNPYGSTLRTDMPASMVGAILAIRTNSGAQVWGWGGNYRSKKDGMHYEIVCSRSDIASGINWSTVPKLPGSTPAPPAPGQPVDPYAWVPTNVLRSGARGDAVVRVQLAVDALTPFAKLGNLQNIATDGDYGKATFARVVEFQRFARGMQLLAGERAESRLIKVDGEWGPATANAAKFWLPAAAAAVKR